MCVNLIDVYFLANLFSEGYLKIIYKDLIDYDLYVLQFIQY